MGSQNQPRKQDLRIVTNYMGRETNNITVQLQSISYRRLQTGYYHLLQPLIHLFMISNL